MAYNWKNNKCQHTHAYIAALMSFVKSSYYNINHIMSILFNDKEEKDVGIYKLTGPNILAKCNYFHVGAAGNGHARYFVIVGYCQCRQRCSGRRVYVPRWRVLQADLPGINI
eukprot:508731-Ditylum_brightwellii.AAC.2